MTVSNSAMDDAADEWEEEEEMDTGIGRTVSVDVEKEIAENAAVVVDVDALMEEEEEEIVEAAGPPSKLTI